MTPTPLTLLIAPSGHGKTSMLVERLHAATSPAWVLLPTPLAVEIWHAHIDCSNLQVLTFGQFARRFADMLPDSPTFIDIATQYMLVRRTVRRLADQNALGLFAPIADTGGFIRTLTAFLEEWTHTAQPIPDHIEHERLRLLFNAYRAYQTILHEHNLADQHTLLRVVLNALEEDRFSPGIPALVVDGFADLSPLHCRLLAALARHGTPVTVALTDNSPRTVDIPFQRTRERLRRFCAEAGVPVEEHPLATPPPTRPAGLAHIQASLFEPAAPPFPPTHHADAQHTLHLVEAADIEGEIRAVLRHVRRWLDSGTPAHHILLVAPNLDETAPLLTSISHEYNIPLALAREEPLAANPLISHIITLLDIPRRNFRREDLLDAWHSPFFQWAWPDTDATHMLERLSAEEIVVRGRDTWLDMLTPLPEQVFPAEDEQDDESGRLRLDLSRSAPDVLETLRTRLAAFFQRLTPPKSATFPEYVDWLRTLLDDAHIPEALQAETSLHSERHRVAWETFQHQLDSLAKGATLADLGTLTWHTFVSMLRATLNGVRYFYRSHAPHDAVLATDTTLARAVQRPVLCLLRLNESVWPSPTPPDPLLRRHERQHLHENGIPLRQPDPAAEVALFYELIAHAQQLLLSRTRFDDNGTIWPPSPFWTAITDLLPDDLRQACTETIRRGAPPTADTAIAPAEQVLATVLGEMEEAPATLAERIARVQQNAHIEQQRLSGEGGVYDGCLPNEPPFRDVLARLAAQTWSASAFRDYALSPVRYFARRVLRLREPETLREGIHRRHYGQLIHALLEQTFAQMSAPLTAETLPQVLAQLETIADELFATAPERFGFRPDPLWEWEKISIHRMVRRLLHWEATQSDWPLTTPFKQEQEITFDLPLGECTIRVTGFIDRIDRDESGRLHLFDYKTGSKPINPDEIIKGRHVQLPIYWWGAEHAFQTPVASARFIHVRTCKTSGNLERETFAEHDAAIREKLADVVRHVQAGVFPAVPTQPEKNGRCAGFCTFINFCRCGSRRVVQPTEENQTP
ncbi:PD-(D/E)XK nuclease family protein [Ardenticatena maritima]|uniref:Uncharacterized protein n=4 Tax=Ardenticatena maritima TaxID=872965 RepID=A0A0N8GR74_9CHLR|nr:PD-(D/E)XK nuclease family protein [Ardenticatena maritima]KPL85706.1 hypothetical protein SE16_15105 [Ardenticatena maritima]